MVTPAAQQGGEKMKWYLRDLDMKSSVGFHTKHADVYYGLENYRYAIVPNKVEAVGFGITHEVTTRDYEGSGGIRVGSLVGKLLWSIYYRDQRIFFSASIGNDSKVLIRRNIRERIKELTPFLSLENDPYVVVTSDGLFWIQDAYTTSNRYPLSQPWTTEFRSAEGIEEERLNYIRNSVKVVVDAYNGTTDFYIVDPSDPIVRAYNIAFPGLFKTFDQIPKELIPHLSYPSGFFYLQMQLYAKYHQVDPDLFYQQSETWGFPQIDSSPVKPYYLTIDLQETGLEPSEQQKFVLVSPMTPVNRDNLRVVSVAGCLGPETCQDSYVAKIALYKFPREIQVDGPSQVSALINQDPTVSKYFTLWDQRGSEVKQGRIIVLPIGKTVVYIQPIYLVATGKTKIPELARLVVVINQQVGMDVSLQGALQIVADKLRNQSGLAPVSVSEMPLPPLSD